MPKPNLHSFKKLFQSGKSFSITREQYQKDSGATLPKQPYLQKNSALARMAKEYGYDIKVENVIIFCEKKEN